MSNLNLNKIILAGRLTSDVELKQTPLGVSVCSFTLAVNRKFSANGFYSVSSLATDRRVYCEIFQKRLCPLH